MHYLWKIAPAIGLLWQFTSGQVKADTPKFSAFGVVIELEEEGVFKKEWSSRHTVYMTHDNGVYFRKFNVGLLKKKHKDYYTADLKSTAEVHDVFKPQLNQALNGLKSEAYFGETGRGRDKQIVGHLFIDVDDYHYLHFYLKRGVDQFNMTMEVLNEVLNKVRINQATGQGQLATNKIKHFNFKVMDVTGSQYVRGDEGTNVMLRQGRNGEILMLWPDALERHQLTVLSTEGRVIKEFNFRESEVYDVIAHDDAFTVLISHPNEVDGNLRYHHLYIEQYDWNQKQLWSTHLMGVDDIKKVGDQRFAYWGSSSTRLAWSGEYYAAYFASYRKWPDLVTHQGDVFLTLTADGKVMHEMEEYYAYNSTWGVSHSFSQELIFDGEKFYCMALGDAYPRAIWLERSYPVEKSMYTRYNAETGKFLEFPGKTGDNYVYDTDFSRPVLDDKNQVLFLYGTELRVNGKRTATYGKSTCNDLFLKVLDTACKVRKSFQITATPDWEERNMSLAWLGNSKVLIKYQRIDPMPKGARKPSAFAGDVEEMLVVYNLNTKKKEAKSTIKAHYHDDMVAKFSLDSDRGSYTYDAGSYGRRLACSELYTHSDGRVFMVKFLLEGSGFQLIEILPSI